MARAVRRTISVLPSSSGISIVSCGISGGGMHRFRNSVSRHHWILFVYRPQFLGHRIEPYATLASG